VGEVLVEEEEEAEELEESLAGLLRCQFHDDVGTYSLGITYTATRPLSPRRLHEFLLVDVFINDEQATVL